MFRWVHRRLQRLEVNCGPGSEVMVEGTPKRAIQWCRRAVEKASAVVEVRGMASGHREVGSIMVRRWVCWAEGGMGPTRSTCM